MLRLRQFGNGYLGRIAEWRLQAAEQVAVLLALQQQRDSAAFELRAFAGQAVAGVSHAQPHAAFGPCQRHIQQAHVFVHTGLGDVAVFLIVFAAGRGFETAEKRHKHKRVFQAFAFVKGDDLHAMRIGFQTHFLFFRVVLCGLNLLRQKMQQGLRPGQPGGSGLQQFTQVQQVGQRPAALGLRQQSLGNALAVHPLVEHGQHAVLLPLLQPLLTRLGQRIA